MEYHAHGNAQPGVAELSLNARTDFPIQEANVPEIRAVLDAPGELQPALAFQDTLVDLDPSAPRSDGLTQALIATLSLQTDDVALTQKFVENSLSAELATQLPDKDSSVALASQTISLITTLLYNRCNQSLGLEHALIALRRTLFEFSQTGNAPDAQQTALAEAMARHSFGNEYIWTDTAEERAHIDALVRDISACIEAGGKIPAFRLFLIGAYRPLYSVPAVRTWVASLAQQTGPDLDPTLRLLVFNPMVENKLQVDVLTPIESAVSTKVKAQYEENPYPRWRHLPSPPKGDSLAAYVSNQLGYHQISKATASFSPKVLVAGSGTGKHPVLVAQALPAAAVLAIDLSRASLAYATREANERGVHNLAFGQADILKLSGVESEFDLVESAGVLHHMEDPEVGLRTLVAALKPGGFLRLGLYSRAARQAVNDARAKYADGNYAPGLAGIRQFRTDVVPAQDGLAYPLWVFGDYYRASPFRDLAMHVQEHQFTIPDIAGMLKGNGLKFLGFANPGARRALRQMPFKSAKRMSRDLKAWDRFEQRNPSTFADMYQFFCVKR